MRKIHLIAMVALLTVLMPPAARPQAPNPAPAVYAEDFNNWTFLSTAANTYTSNSWNCWSTPLERGIPSYFVFGNPNTSTYYPVLIRDANPLLSEIVMPSSISTAQSACGFSASATNTHTSFWLQSGTAGLQDAVAALNGLTLSSAMLLSPSTVYLDKYWYGLVAALPTTPSVQTPASIIAALHGSVAVNLVDTTTAPWTVYTWNGTNYAAVSSATSLPTLRVSSFTNIAVPTALTTVAATCATNGGGCITTATTGGTIPASGAYTLGATCVDASGGETTLSVDTAGGATVTVGSTATNTISVTSPAGCTAANGAVGYRIYMTAASGGSLSEILYSPSCSATLSYLYQNVLVAGTVCPVGSTATIGAIITGTATVPAINSAWPRVAGSSGSTPPFTAAGTTATTVVATLASINLPAGYLNTLGKQLTVCGNGYASNNNTTGTVALTAVLSSVPGVTSITPVSITYTTATTTAVQVPLDFCMTFTTAVTGSSGKLEAHGWLDTRTATSSTGGAGQIAVDNIFAVSSAIDLTKQDELLINITPTTTGLTAAQVRQLSIVGTN